MSFYFVFILGPVQSKLGCDYDRPVSHYQRHIIVGHIYICLLIYIFYLYLYLSRGIAAYKFSPNDPLPFRLGYRTAFQGKLWASKTNFVMRLFEAGEKSGAMATLVLTTLERTDQIAGRASLIVPCQIPTFGRMCTWRGDREAVNRVAALPHSPASAKGAPIYYGLSSKSAGRRPTCMESLKGSRRSGRRRRLRGTSPSVSTDTAGHMPNEISDTC